MSGLCNNPDIYISILGCSPSTSTTPERYSVMKDVSEDSPSISDETPMILFTYTQ
jgi:hypothetical protein